MNIEVIIKQKLISYLIGLYSRDNVILQLYNLLNDSEHNFYEVLAKTFYDENVMQNTNNLGLLFDNKDFKIFEENLFYFIKQKEKLISDKNKLKLTYAFFKIKEEYFNLTSNEIEEFIITIFSNYELLIDGYETNVDFSEIFSDYLKYNKGVFRKNTYYKITFEN